MKKIQCSGQGLLETMLILLFVAFSVVALISYKHYLAYSADNAQQQADATLLAVQKLETLRDFQVLSPTSGYVDYASIASGTSTSTVGNTSYTITSTVTTTATPSYKTLSVTVSWTNRTGTTKSVTLVTNVAGVDPSNPAVFM